MIKAKKIIFMIVMIFLLVGFQICYAVDLNMTDDSLDTMDLTTNSPISTTNNTNTNSNEENTNTNSNSNISSNTNSNENASNSSNRTNTNYENEINTTTPSTMISNIDSASDDTLGLANILNILLIVIGVLLVLLAIAILIRLKK